MKTNVTLRLDRDLLQEARVLAARQGLSVSRLMSEHLEGPVRKDKDYEKAERRALERLEKGYDLGWNPPASRDELHER